MVSAEERGRVLEMIEAGKLSVDEATRYIMRGAIERFNLKWEPVVRPRRWLREPLRAPKTGRVRPGAVGR